MNKIDLETFIFVHDQEIILNYENNNKFSNIGKYKYVFLGAKQTNLLNEFNNIIYAKDLPYNLESHPKMCAYSGWYALFKNNLITTKYVNLFEYDILLNDDFLNTLISIINSKNSDFYGYKPFNLNECFLNNDIWAIDILNYYGYSCDDIIKKAIKQGISLWSTTSNVTMTSEFFKRYMIDNENLFLYMKSYDSVGHGLERNLSIYQIMNKDINVSYITNLIYHFQLDSHLTQGIFNEEKYKKIITNYHV